MDAFFTNAIRGVVVSSVVVLAGCAAPEPEFKLGATVSNPLVIAEKQIPLPRGRWVVRGQNVITTDAGTRIIQMILLDADRNVPRISIWVGTNLQPSVYFEGWGVSRICSRDDMHHRVTKSNIQWGDQECWYVNHARLGRSSRTPKEVLQVYDFVKSRGRAVPANTVVVGYRFANDYDVLSIRYHFNPEAEGFAPPKRAAWKTSDWHVDKVVSDPKKVQYIDRLKWWGLDWLPKVKAGFEGKLSRGTNGQIPDVGTP